MIGYDIDIRFWSRIWRRNTLTVVSRLLAVPFELVAKTPVLSSTPVNRWLLQYGRSPSLIWTSKLLYIKIERSLRYSPITSFSREHRPSNAPGLSGFIHHSGRWSEHIRQRTRHQDRHDVDRQPADETKQPTRPHLRVRLSVQRSRGQVGSEEWQAGVCCIHWRRRAKINKTSRVCTYKKHTSAQ